MPTEAKPAAAKLTVARRAAGRLTGSSVRRESAQVSELQRSRILSSAVAVVAEAGHAQMSVTRITGRAGVSRRTFYDLFEDREDCFLAAFEDSLTRLTVLLVEAYEGENAWRAQVRAALSALLWFLDAEPGMRSVLVIEALHAGPRVLERRALALEQLSSALHEGGVSAGRRRTLLPLTAEGVVGAVFSVVHSRLLGRGAGSMVELLNPLMGMIVLPYLGAEAAERELGMPAPSPRPSSHTPAIGMGAERLARLPMRITYRTLRVLTAIAEHPGASNREVSSEAGVADQGQMSKLLSRLEGLGLIENSGAAEQPSGEPNAWHLTPFGGEAQQVIKAQSGRADRQAHGTRESH